jgi:L-alanine-DL-glutamate epimerase-like enolase superfamily enzyme
MRIESVSFQPCVMPKEDPSWRFALAATSESTGWLVTMRSDAGLVGYGYATTPAHMGETQEGFDGRLNLLARAIADCDPLNIECVHLTMDRALQGNNFAKAGLDNALYALKAEHLGVPLYQLLGGKTRSEIPILRILAIKSPAEMAANAQKLVDEGYRYLKIKVHGDVAEDVERVAAIRGQVGPDIHLTIDANQAYTPKAAIVALRRMENLNIDLAEQPVHVDDLRGLEQVTRNTTIPVEADESADSVDQIYTLVRDRLVDRVSLKVAKLGGIRNTLQAAAICAAGKVPYRLGATVGSRLLAAPSLHLAAALPYVDYACELAEYERLLNDPFEGLPVTNGVLRVPDEPGLGVTKRAVSERVPAAARA